MQVRFGTKTYDWSEKLNMRMAMQLKRDRQITPKGFILGMEELDPASIDALHYIVRVEAGEDGRSVPRLGDNFDFFADFELIVPDDEDPTGPASTPDRAERTHEILTAAVKGEPVPEERWIGLAAATPAPPSPTPTPPAEAA